jgi:hypothetical protein
MRTIWHNKKVSDVASALTHDPQPVLEAKMSDPTKPIIPKATCSFGECNLPFLARGLCSKHWQQAKRGKIPFGVALIWPNYGSLEERLWPRVNKNGTIPEGKPHLGPCWAWEGTVDGGGYGHITDQGKTMKVHRIVFEWIKGKIPNGLEIDHLCRNPVCCNPEHLEAVTSRINNLRSTSPAAINSKKQIVPRDIHIQGKTTGAHAFAKSA